MPKALLAFAVALGLTITLVAQAPKRNEPAKLDSFKILADLIETYGVSGQEGPVRNKVRAYLPPWAKPEIDGKGNLLITFGSGEEHILFVGHLDEIGYVVRDVQDDGALIVERRGGFFDKYFEARPILVHTRLGPIAGVIGPRAGYRRDTAKDEYTAADVRVYLGTDTRRDTEELGIRKGDSITVPKRFVPLANDRATARSFDDRTGLTAMLLALNRLDPARVRKRITFAFTVEEEVGLNGARYIAERAKANYVFAVDTFVSSDSPREDKRFANTPIGNGFVIRALDTSSVTPLQLVNRVLEIARRHNIPVQYGTTNGGNDGSTFTRYGAVDIPISWPLRYSHSPVEVIQKSDLDALAEIIHHLVMEF